MVITKTNSETLGAGNLEYNFLKVQEGVASIISSHSIRLWEKGKLRSIKEVSDDFLRHVPEELRWRSRPFTHLTLNPDPLDAVSKGELRALALMTLRELEVAENAHVAFLHHDTGRLHAHIVFLRLRPGQKIRKLRATYDLSHVLSRNLGLEPMHPSLDGRIQPRLRPVSLQEPELAAQMRGALLAVREFYTPTTLPEYQAILESFNIRCNLTKGRGGERLHYQVLDEMGQPRTMPVPVQRLGYRYALDHVMDYLDRKRLSLARSPWPDDGILKEVDRLALGGGSPDRVLSRFYERGIQILSQEERLLMVDHLRGRALKLDERTSEALLGSLGLGQGLDCRRQVSFLVSDFFFQRKPLHALRLMEAERPLQKRLGVGLK